MLQNSEDTQNTEQKDPLENLLKQTTQVIIYTRYYKSVDYFISPVLDSTSQWRFTQIVQYSSGSTSPWNPMLWMQLWF